MVLFETKPTTSTDSTTCVLPMICVNSSHDNDNESTSCSQSDIDNSRVYRTYLTYKEELEKFLNKHKHVPQNFEFWPHGPYWPHEDSRDAPCGSDLRIVLKTPKHIRTVPAYHEPLVLNGNYRKLQFVTDRISHITLNSVQNKVEPEGLLSSASSLSFTVNRRYTPYLANCQLTLL